MAFKHTYHREGGRCLTPYRVAVSLCSGSKWQLPFRCEQGTLGRRRTWQRLTTFLTSNSAIKSASNYEAGAAAKAHTHTHIRILLHAERQK